MASTVIVSLAVLLCALHGIEGESPESRRGGKDNPLTIEGIARLERANKVQCKAVLIDEKWVVASAACVESGVDTVVLHHCRNQKDKQCELRLPVARTVTHPFWDEMFNNDIALVMMTKPARGVPRMKLANRERERRAADESSSCYTVDWNEGSGKDQQIVPVRYVDCARRMDGFNIVDPMCSILQMPGCPGASGNPTVCVFSRKRIYLFGIHVVEKMINTRCHNGLTRVSRYLPWFRNVMQNIDNTDVPTGGRCVPPIGNGRNPCQDRYARCMAGFYSYRCQCMDGFKDGQCVITRASLGEACDTSATVPCIDRFTECVDNNVTMTCVCNEKSREQDGVCVYKRHGFGRACFEDSDCVTGQICYVNYWDKISFCICEPASSINEFYNDTCTPCPDGLIFPLASEQMACHPRIPLNQMCMDPSPRNDFMCEENLVCGLLVSGSSNTSPVCKCEITSSFNVTSERCEPCPEGEQNGDVETSCVESKQLGENCTQTGQCPEYAVCRLDTHGKCECSSKYAQHGDSCMQVFESPYGECYDDTFCLAPLRCVDGRCKCPSGSRGTVGECVDICPDESAKCYNASGALICATICDGTPECDPYVFISETAFDETCDLDYASLCLGDAHCDSSMGLICGYMGMCVCRDGFRWDWDTALCIVEAPL